MAEFSLGVNFEDFDHLPLENRESRPSDLPLGRQLHSA